MERKPDWRPGFPVQFYCNRRWSYGTLSVFDIEEFGKQIGEKLFMLLDQEQKNALAQYVLGKAVANIQQTSYKF